MTLLLLLACKQESKVPEDATAYDVTVVATEDQCHPDSTQGYKETFTYLISLDGSDASIYIGEELFASGTVSGCTVTYQTPIIGQDTKSDGNVKWQLFGQADFDDGSNACVTDDNDWEGTEYFEVVSTDNDSLEPGCQYQTTTAGKLSK